MTYTQDIVSNLHLTSWGATILNLQQRNQELKRLSDLFKVTQLTVTVKFKNSQTDPSTHISQGWQNSLSPQNPALWMQVSLLAAAHSPLHTLILPSTRDLESQRGLINSQGTHIMEFNAVVSKSRHAKSTKKQYVEKEN